MSSRVDFNLYLITDRNRTAGRPLLEVLRQALDSGVRGVQLREKDLPVREFLPLAEEARRLTEAYQSKLIINDRVDVCLGVGADGVHLRGDSLPIAAARAVLGPGPFIGFSAHSYPEVIDAEKQGADFAVLGPVFGTPSKIGMGEPIGVDGLIGGGKTASIPVFAIGGITVKRVPEVLKGGIHGIAGIAVISAILESGDVPRAVFNLRKELEKTTGGGVVLRK